MSKLSRIIALKPLFSKSAPLCICHVRNNVTAANVSPKWELFGAVCLERKPILTKSPTPIEEEVIKMMDKLEYVKSLKSDFELRQENERKIQHNPIENLGDSDQETTVKQLTQEYEDAWTEELTKFQPASRVTEADKQGDLSSLNRHLDGHLLLVVSSESNGKKSWSLPQSNWQEGEALHQTAQRALAAHIDAKVRFLGKIPWGVHTVKYNSSQKEKTGFRGAKIFFFKAQVIDKNTVTSCKNHWIERNELGNYLDQNYLHTVSQFLVDED